MVGSGRVVARGDKTRPMKRVLVFLLLVVLIPLSVSAAPSASSTISPARTACSAAEKAAAKKALAKYRHGLQKQRAAYFAHHKSAAARAAFVKRQSARLKALSAAAACKVPAPTSVPPASAGPACSPSLPSSANESPTNEGTDTSPRFARSTGTAHAVLLYVDTSDQPATVDPAADADAASSDVSSWYKNASYGRLTFTVTSVTRWLRLPKPASSYTDRPWEYELRDAVAAADPFVDFSGVDIVYVVKSTLNVAGRGGFTDPQVPIVADGRTLTHFAEFAGPDPSRFHLFIHETGHVLGLPHARADFWDPMDQAAHATTFLGWHLWKLHWIDPAQVRCLDGAGILEDTLSPIEGASGVKLLVAQTGPSTAVVAEMRGGGVLVTKVDANAPDREGLIVQLHDGLGVVDAPLSPGQKVTVGNVTVQVLVANEKAARVRVIQN
jgi:M6 family metalloprotease-like protein